MRDKCGCGAVRIGGFNAEENKRETYQIWSFTRLPSSSIVLILKSIPMVVMKDVVKASSQKRSKRHDLPTPVSPIRRSLKTTSYPAARDIVLERKASKEREMQG